MMRAGQRHANCSLEAELVGLLIVLMSLASFYLQHWPQWPGF